ncbi:acyl-CoA dehydrogenase family protein [Nocardia gipuzkoensis]
MDFSHDETTEQLRITLVEFMQSHVYPAESNLLRQSAERPSGWSPPPVVEHLQAEARARGLWNLSLAGEDGAGLTNLQYAPLAEITGRSPYLAPIALNCAAPDSGNMQVLSQFGTARQRERWLKPLLEGKIRSAFAVTESDATASHGTAVGTTITRDGDSYVVNGRKWYVIGAMDPRCDLFIVMGRTASSVPLHRQQSMILVPRETPGLTITRRMTVAGFDDSSHGGHAVVAFDDVRVPADNLLVLEGAGLAIAQTSTGADRIHHCMRAIGLAERAIELMCRHSLRWVASGKALSEQGTIEDWIAEARVRIEQIRLLVLKTAWLIDTAGILEARSEIQAIRIATPATTDWILDKALRTHDAAGLSPGFPLAEMWNHIRAIQFTDGPGQLHRRSLVRHELTKYEAVAGAL